MTACEQTCILIPTLNEEQTIGEVIDGFQNEGFINILVMDGNSTDSTLSIATDHGARVETQTKTGKGQAIREARQHIDSEYILMTDGDTTYRPQDAHAMLKPLENTSANHVIGNRFAKIHPDAMSRLNRFGNSVINTAFRKIHREDYSDILSGYRAFTSKGFDKLFLDIDGFGIETEIAVECVKNNIPTSIVPIHYDPRPDGSETNLSPVTHGAHIIATLYRLAKTNNPLFYFSTGGLISILLGGSLSIYVIYDWVTNHLSHDVLALIAAFFILIGVQLIMFGVLADMLMSFHKRQMREMRRE